MIIGEESIEDGLSPLTRGTQLESHSLAVPERFIPADAGTPYAIPPDHTPSGLSPLTREHCKAVIGAISGIGLSR